MSGSVQGLLPRYTNEDGVPGIVSELAGFFFFIFKKPKQYKNVWEARGYIVPVIRTETGKASMWAGKELWDLIRTFSDIQGVDQWKL